MFNFIDKLKNTVSKTAKALIGDVIETVSEEEQFSEFVLDDMEDLLISADLGVSYASELIDKLRKNTNAKPSEVKNFLQEEFIKLLDATGSSKLNYKKNELNIYFITGVNGAGKTTLIGKLERINEVDGGYEVVFKISNGIEHLISAREIELEIVWWNTTGLFVLRDSVYEKDGINYVKVIKYGKYSEVPVKILKHNEEYCIIDNYTSLS